MDYKCPHCGSTDLRVYPNAAGQLTRDVNGDWCVVDVESTYWDDSYPVACNDCDEECDELHYWEAA